MKIRTGGRQIVKSVHFPQLAKEIIVYFFYFESLSAPWMEQQQMVANAPWMEHEEVMAMLEIVLNIHENWTVTILIFWVSSSLEVVVVWIEQKSVRF